VAEIDAAVFRDMTEGDLADGLRLSRASGWNQTPADWRLMLALGPGLFRVGVASGRVVASGGAVRYGGDLAWICMILVDPDCRGRGLGTRVFDEVLAGVLRTRERHGLLAVGLDATPEGRGIYAQRGFVPGPPLLRMRAEPPRPRPIGPSTAAPSGAGAPGSTRLRPIEAADLPSVLELDRRVFGADRAIVLRDALASAPALARVAVDGGRVDGYCFGRHGDHSDHLGPVVAGTPALALALVAEALSAAPGRGAGPAAARPMIVDARAEPRWTGALETLGFRAQRPFTRMYLEGAAPRARPDLELAVRGPEMG
jgi:GNAT superfamily N-acetyltransferase